MLTMGRSPLLVVVLLSWKQTMPFQSWFINTDTNIQLKDVCQFTAVCVTDFKLYFEVSYFGNLFYRK